MAEYTPVPRNPSERRLRHQDLLEFFEELPEEVARLRGQTWPLLPWPLRRPLRRLSQVATQVATTWAPSVDIYERAGNLVVKVDLPGVRKDDLEVALERGDLVIHGERKPEGELKDEDYYRAERPVGRFYRRMPLPFEASPEQVRASFTDGVLDISIPKPPEEPPQPQKISVA